MEEKAFIPFFALHSQPVEGEHHVASVYTPHRAVVGSDDAGAGDDHVLLLLLAPPLLHADRFHTVKVTRNCDQPVIEPVTHHEAVTGLVVVGSPAFLLEIFLCLQGTASFPEIKMYLVKSA